MMPPSYMCPFSLMENKVQIHGNVELAEELKLIVKEKCVDSLELYEAQEFMRNYCIDNYGADWYEKSSEAVQHIIENEYCQKERNKLPAFDMQQYKEDMRRGVLY